MKSSHWLFNYELHKDIFVIISCVTPIITVAACFGSCQVLLQKLADASANDLVRIQR